MPLTTKGNGMLFCFSDSNFSRCRYKCNFGLFQRDLNKLRPLISKKLNWGHNVLNFKTEPKMLKDAMHRGLLVIFPSLFLYES